MRWGAMVWDSSLYRSDPFSSQRHPEEAERHIAVHFPRRLDPLDATSAIYYDTKPDWYTATLSSQAIPTDIVGCHIFTATSSSISYDTIPPPATSFHEWIQQLPPAERRLISSHYFDECDAEQAALLQYLQIPCTLLIGTDGGKRHHSGSFSWILCSLGHEKLVLNAGPASG